MHHPNSSALRNEGDTLRGILDKILQQHIHGLCRINPLAGQVALDRMTLGSVRNLRFEIFHAMTILAQFKDAHKNAALPFDSFQPQSKYIWHELIHIRLQQQFR